MSNETRSNGEGSAAGSVKVLKKCVKVDKRRVKAVRKCVKVDKRRVKAGRKCVKVDKRCA